MANKAKVADHRLTTLDPLERVIRPIVEGQLRSFANDHPCLLEKANWARTKPALQTFVDSGAKRILRDLLCAETRMRLMAALGGIGSADAVDVEPVT